MNVTQFKEIMTDYANGEAVYLEITKGVRKGSIVRLVNPPTLNILVAAWRVQIADKIFFVSPRMLVRSNECETLDARKIAKDHFDILDRQIQVGMTVAVTGPMGRTGQEIALGVVDKVDAKVHVRLVVSPSSKNKSYSTSKSGTVILIIDDEMEPFIMEKMLKSS